MRFLPDTHLLLWAAAGSPKLSREAARILEDPSSDIYFSVVTVWEASIKHALKRPDFHVDPRNFRQALLTAGFHELQVTSEHAIAVGTLPPLHKDPFDRLLVAQAEVERLILLTGDVIAGAVCRSSPCLSLESTCDRPHSRPDSQQVAQRGRH